MRARRTSHQVFGWITNAAVILDDLASAIAKLAASRFAIIFGCIIANACILAYFFVFGTFELACTLAVIFVAVVTDAIVPRDDFVITAAELAASCFAIIIGFVIAGTDTIFLYFVFTACGFAPTIAIVCITIVTNAGILLDDFVFAFTERAASCFAIVTLVAIADTAIVASFLILAAF